MFAALDRTDREYYRDPPVQVLACRLRREQRENAAALAALEAPLRVQAGEAYTALTRRLEELAAGAQGVGAIVSRGYHSALAKTADAVKWVQVDLGETVEIDRVSLLPALDEFNGIGAGLGFPVRFKVEVSDDPEFSRDVKLLWIRYDIRFMADFPNLGLTPFATGGTKDDGIAGRCVRVTVTKLAPRKDDFMFALPKCA